MLGMFIFPPLIRYFDNVYGWRGALLLMGAIIFHLEICGTLLKPNTSSDSVTKHKGIKAEDTETKERTKTICENAWTMFKNPSFLLLCVNNVLICIGLSVFLVHISAYSTDYGYSRDASALTISAMGIAGIVSRLIYGFIVQCKVVSGMSVYILSYIVGGTVAILYSS